MTVLGFGYSSVSSQIVISPFILLVRIVLVSLGFLKGLYIRKTNSIKKLLMYKTCSGLFYSQNLYRTFSAPLLLGQFLKINLHMNQFFEIIKVVFFYSAKLFRNSSMSSYISIHLSLLLLSNISLFVFTMFYLSICLSIDIGLFPIWGYYR